MAPGGPQRGQAAEKLPRLIGLAAMRRDQRMREQSPRVGVRCHQRAGCGSKSTGTAGEDIARPSASTAMV